MVRTVFRVYVLMLVTVAVVLAATPQLPWGMPGIVRPTTTTENSDIPPPKQDSCPEPTDQLKACIRQWDCQELLRLDLRCLLNLNGLPLVGNALGGILGGIGGQPPAQRPALGSPGGGLLGGTGGILGSLLG